MKTLRADFRQALRMLAGHPGLTAAAVICLALGIGANSAIFSVVNAALLRPLPYTDPDNLVMVWEHNTVHNGPRNVVGPANFLRWKDRSSSFAAMAPMMSWRASLTGTGEPAHLPAGIVATEFFDVLGVEPLRGRFFLPADGVEGAPNVAVVSRGFWQRVLGSDPEVVGRTLTLNDEPTTIVGMAGPEVRLPGEVDLWLPFSLGERHRTARGRWMQVVARLAPGVSVEQAEAELRTIAAALEEETPDFNAGWTVDVARLQDDLVHDMRAPVLTLFGAVAFVLLIACANVANLLLAHAAGRRRELAIRAALGAGRFEIIRLLVTESLVLALLGGAAGALVAAWCVAGLSSFAAETLPGIGRIGIDGTVMAFTLGLSVLTGLLFGIAPALHACRRDLVDSLRSGTRAIAGDGGARWTRSALIVTQVALSLVLLVGSGLLIHSLRNLTSVDPGFATTDVLTLNIDLPSTRYPEPAQQARYFADALLRIEALPGVTSAAGISWLPLGSPGAATSFTVLDRPAPAAGEEPAADVRSVTPGFFSRMGMRLLAGRELGVEDSAEAPRRVVVNRTLAETFWPGEDPLGRRIAMSWGEDLQAEIVGVVEDARLTRPDTPSRHTLYWAHAQLPYDFMTLMVRYEGARPPVDAIRGQLRSIDPLQPIADVRTMDEVLSRAVSRERFTTGVLGFFSTVALLLAAVGIYGVISYATGQRVREFGVRMALGARGADVLRQVLGQGLRLAAAGALLGVAASLALTRLLRGLLFEVSATDPATFGVVVVLLLVTLLAACWIPARRATRVDPVTALRCD